MHWIIEFLVRHRNIFSLLLTSVFSLWMVSASATMQARIVRSLTVTVFYPLQYCLNQFTRINNIFGENRRLREEVADLRTRESLLEEQGAENVRLRKLLNFSQSCSFNLLPVRVIARDPSPLFRSIVIDAGKNDGVVMWMPLVGEQGLVGKVVQVMRGMSLVQLLSDPSNRTSVIDRRTRAVSVLETENGSEFFIRCRSHEDVQTGDTIITSGLGGIYPAGLLVGFVDRVLDHDPLFTTMSLKLAIDFRHLEEVFVVKISSQWTSFKKELDSIDFKD
jgi:rod shape-determining protein MreC